LHLDSIEINQEVDVDDLSRSAPRDIDLPHLESLSLIFMDGWAVQFILARIITPLHLALKLELQGLQPDQDLRHIFPPNPTNLRNLQNIDLFIFCPNDCRDLCEAQGHSADLRVPTLSIIIHGGRGNGPVQRIMSSLGPALSVMPLRAFALQRYSSRKWSASTLFRMFDHFPSIQLLSFRDCHPKFLQALAVSPSHHPCPRLRILKITDCIVPDKTLISIVRSRTKHNKDIQPPATHLKCLRLYGSLNKSTDVITVLSGDLNVEWHPRAGIS